MLTLNGWHVEQDALPPAESNSGSERLCWQDPASTLSVSQLGSPDEGIYRLRLGPDLEVEIWPDRRVFIRPSGRLTQTNIDHLIADQVFPRLMAYSGAFVVHAGAVRMGEVALMLMGQSGRGKSTLVKSFDLAGLALLGDDAMIVSALDARPSVRPVYPSLRLFPDSIEAMMPDAVTAGPVAPYSTKQRIDVPIADGLNERAIPIEAIFSIAKPAEDGQIGMRPLTVAETCMVLVESSFALDPANVVQARRRLDDASALARQVPAFELSYPRDYARLPELRQAILDRVATQVVS